jgi:hypothetical protein
MNAQTVYWIDGDYLGIGAVSTSGTIAALDADLDIVIYHESIVSDLKLPTDPLWADDEVPVPEEFQDVVLDGCLHLLYKGSPEGIDMAKYFYNSYEKGLKDMKKWWNGKSKHKTHYIQPVEY